MISRFSALLCAASATFWRTHGNTCSLYGYTPSWTASDLCAEGALRALRDEGLRVPEDVAVVGYDDTWFAATTHPPFIPRSSPSRA